MVIATRTPFRVHRHPGNTDDARIRHIQALLPLYAVCLFDAQATGATDRQLQNWTVAG